RRRCWNISAFVPVSAGKSCRNTHTWSGKRKIPSSSPSPAISSPSIASRSHGVPPARSTRSAPSMTSSITRGVDGGQQLLFGADVVVQRALADAVRPAQFRRAGGVIAPLGEDLRRRVHDPTAAPLPLGALSFLVCHPRLRHNPAPSDRRVRRRP